MPHKTVVITGATSGIGKASAELFLSNDNVVLAVGRNVHELDELSSRYSSTLHTFAADLREVREIDRLCAHIRDRFESVNVLINAAGIIKNGTIENTTIEDWDSMMDINLRSVFYLMHCFVPVLKSAKGNIINVSSVTGQRAFPNVLAYCVSKAGIDQLTRCAALELAAFGIRVNAVNPGVVVTNIHKRGGMEAETYERFLEHSKTTHPIGRVGTAEEVAELIYFLASEKASWITGATYEIDGGRAQTCAR